jgi:APA family basic amino acid/polyamine antiporter
MIIITYINIIAIIIGVTWLALLTIWYFAYARNRWNFLSADDMENMTNKVE